MQWTVNSIYFRNNHGLIFLHSIYIGETPVEHLSINFDSHTIWTAWFFLLEIRQVCEWHLRTNKNPNFLYLKLFLSKHSFVLFSNFLYFELKISFLKRENVFRQLFDVILRQAILLKVPLLFEALEEPIKIPPRHETSKSLFTILIISFVEMIIIFLLRLEI